MRQPDLRDLFFADGSRRTYAGSVKPTQISSIFDNRAVQADGFYGRVLRTDGFYPRTFAELLRTAHNRDGLCILAMCEQYGRCVAGEDRMPQSGTQ